VKCIGPKSSLRQLRPQTGSLPSLAYTMTQMVNAGPVTSAVGNLTPHVRRGLGNGHKHITKYPSGKVVGLGSHRGGMEVEKAGGAAAFLDGERCFGGRRWLQRALLARGEGGE
jgi:hypothetical protein